MNKTDYIAFHKDMTARIAAGDAPADLKYLVYSTQSFTQTPEGMVKKNVVGGFADRMKGVVSCLFLAAATNRYFVIDWQDPRPLETDFSPADVNWTAPFDKMGLQKGEMQLFNMIDDGFERYAKTVANGDAESIWAQVRCAVVNINRITTSLVENPTYKQDLESFLEGPLCEQEFFYQAYHTLFSYTPTDAPVREAFETLRGKLMAKPYRVGVQFRTGGDGNWPDPRLDSHENYTLLMQAAEKKLAAHGGEAALFVTTDSAAVKQRIIEEYGPRYDIVFLDVPPVHYERSGGKAAIGSSFMIAENTLLGLCDDIIVGAGGFGIIGAWRQNKQPSHYAYGPIRRAVLLPTAGMI